MTLELPPWPRVGDLVHYVSYGTPGGEYTSECRAAIVAAVPGPDDPDSRNLARPVDLCVLNPSGLFFNRCTEDDRETPAGGTWHSMEACDA